LLYIAYTREDALFAVQLVEDLAELGVEVWLDLNEIGPGADWDAAQSAAIAVCEGLIVVLSPEATQRDHMRREINRAFERDKPVYLAVARPAPWLDWMHDLPVANFTESYESGLNALLLHLMGQEAQRPTDNLDPAEAFLREAAEGKYGRRKKRLAQSAHQGQRRQRRSLLSRLLRRP
jgi:hypothetical protein